MVELIYSKGSRFIDFLFFFSLPALIMSFHFPIPFSCGWSLFPFHFLVPPIELFSVGRRSRSRNQGVGGGDNLSTPRTDWTRVVYGLHRGPYLVLARILCSGSLGNTTFSPLHLSARGGKYLKRLDETETRSSSLHSFCRRLKL